VHRGLELPSFGEQSADGLGTASSPSRYVTVGVCNKKKWRSIERAKLLKKRSVFEGTADGADGDWRNVTGDHDEVQWAASPLYP
jgi:hypothetical protein